MEREAYESTLLAKLNMDSALIGGSSNKSSAMLKGLDDTYKLYLGLKLPEVAEQLKIGDKTQLSEDSITELKALLESAQSEHNKNG
jgi:hypothetical protein